MVYGMIFTTLIHSSNPSGTTVHHVNDSRGNYRNYGGSLSRWSLGETDEMSGK